jgi:hypothetical protein
MAREYALHALFLLRTQRQLALIATAGVVEDCALLTRL